MYVILDTNCIYGDFSLKSTAINKLLTSAKKGKHKVFISEVVIQETKRHYKEKLTEIQNAVEGQLKEFKRKAAEDLPNPITTPLVGKKIRKYGRDLQTRIKELGIEILPLPTDSHRLLLRRSVNKVKPFKENGSGYEDALIWLTILEKANEFSENISIHAPQIIFITNNHTDFCQSKKYDLHSDLIADLEDNDIDTLVIKVVPDLKSAFGMLYINSDTARSKDIMSFLTGPRFAKSDLIENIKKRIMDYLPYKEFRSEEIGFPQIYESPIIDMFEEDFVFEPAEVNALNEREVAIRLDVSLTCFFDIYIAKSDLSYFDDDEGPSIYDYDWNNHYVAAQEEKNVWFTVDLITDFKLGNIKSFDIEINEDRNDAKIRKFLSPDLL